MNGRIFFLLLIVVAVIGIAAAAGVIAYLERGGDESQTTLAELPEAPAGARIGAASEPAASPDGASESTLAAVEALAGTVESVEESSLTLAITEGAETVVVDKDTQFTLFLDRSVEDLEEGASVTLMGQRDEQGEMRAAVLLLGDAGAGAFGGLAGAFGGEGLQAGGRQISPEDLASLRAQLGALAGAGEGGQIPPEARERLRALAAQPRGGGGDGGLGAGAGFARRGGVSGTITQVDDGRITIDTDRGPVETVLNDETQIREVTAEGKLADLPVGAQVTAVGSRDNEGAFHAAQVAMTPDFGETLGGLLSPGGRQQEGSTGP